MIKVIVADDHALVREGIAALLERTGEIQVIGKAADGNEAVRLTEELKPDVLLIDLSMPNLNGVEALKRITGDGSGTNVLVVSVHLDEAIIIRALRAGAKGYLPKDSFKEELYLAVQTVARGGIYLSPRLAETLLDYLVMGPMAWTAPDPMDRLSPREREVFQLILEGKTNRQIGEHLQISIKTVDKHRTSLMKKLGVHDVTGLMHIALQNGMLYVRDKDPK